LGCLRRERLQVIVCKQKHTCNVRSGLGGSGRTRHMAWHWTIATLEVLPNEEHYAKICGCTVAQNIKKTDGESERCSGLDVQRAYMHCSGHA